MNTNDCHDVHTLLGPYLDSELDAKTSLELSVHLKDCPACAARLIEETAWQKRFKTAFTEGPLTEGLWGPIEERIREADQPTAAVSRGLAAPLTRHWRYWLWPSPRLYAGLAAAWAVIVAVQVGTREPSRGGVVFTPETRTALAEQRHLLAELLGTNGAEPEPVGKTPQPPQTDARRPGHNGAYPMRAASWKATPGRGPVGLSRGGGLFARAGEASFGWRSCLVPAGFVVPALAGGAVCGGPKPGLQTASVLCSMAINPPSPALRAPSPIGWERVGVRARTPSAIGWERDGVRVWACIGPRTWSSAAHHLTT